MNVRVGPVGLIGVFVSGFLWPVFVLLFGGGNKDIVQTIKTVMYASTPFFLLGWIPVVAFLGYVWYLALLILGFKETLDGLKRGEVFFPSFGYRNTYDKYFEDGNDEMARASAEGQRILALPDPDPLPPEVDRELRRIVVAADKACEDAA